MKDRMLGIDPGVTRSDVCVMDTTVYSRNEVIRWFTISGCS